MSSFSRDDLKHIAWGVVIVFSLMALTMLISKRIGMDNIDAYITSLGIRWPFFLIIIKALTIVIAPLSGTAIYVIGGSLFGLKRGTIYLFLGNLIGTSIAFWIGRLWGKKAMIRMCGNRAGRKVIMLLEHLSTPWKFFLARVTLLPLEDLVSYAAWLSHLKYRIYISITMLVITVYSLFFIRMGELSIFW